MNRTIEFDTEFLLGTIKIEYVIADVVLVTEFEIG